MTIEKLLHLISKVMCPSLLISSLSLQVNFNPESGGNMSPETLVYN